ncbi:PREDICTED: A disintegrin and metalloproteinase with thrombospondin motifs 3-like isoform X2 [Mandrillus leucophaeus]|uniref:A disintegrin and metalloproteinase with thrombospondin motifs 3-like isoform X2 n=2 Tax=Mandrillus leucophaeus TaxID=9568 RepID=UPI0005F3FD8D|nr:PREDICTED: A disintegrin and metalloproteinase with thrombospondin motifs 3-like isoform X2 [Mandrillus leucophaeus]
MVLLSLWLIAAALVEVRTSADGQAGNEEMVQIDLPIKRYREYELVTPVSTNLEGRYLSHTLSASHKKRSARDVSSNPEQLFFNITAFGKDFHLRLKPNTQLVAPGAVVEWRETSLVPGNITDPINNHQPGSATDRIRKTEPLQTNCAYVGDIVDIPGTSVAISNCDGLNSVITPVRHSSHMEKQILEIS